METTYKIAAVMFILSTVCERLAEFLKKYLSDSSFRGFKVVGNTIAKGPIDSIEESDRQFRILKINLLCGFITAFICHASLFDILSNLSGSTKSSWLGWPDLTGITFSKSYIFPNLVFVAGCLLTGAFISLGSKFWHDLLDLLFQFKNAQRQIGIVSQGFDSLNDEEKDDLISAAVKENHASWKLKFDNYLAAGPGRKSIDGKVGKATVLKFKVSNKTDSFPPGSPRKIPKFIYYSGYKIPTDVVPGEVATASDGINYDTLPRPLGSSMYRENGTEGTIGLCATLQDAQNSTVGITCFHVLFSKEFRNNTWKIAPESTVNNSTVMSPSERYNSSVAIGNAYCGQLTTELDIGIFKTDNEYLGSEVYAMTAQPRGKKDVVKSDEHTLELKMMGAVSNLVTGVLDQCKVMQPVKFFAGTANEKEISIEMIQVKAKCRRGDSGAAVLTKSDDKAKDGLVIGILAAIDSEHAYVIPISKIESAYNIKINYSNV